MEVKLGFEQYKQQREQSQQLQQQFEQVRSQAEQLQELKQRTNQNTLQPPSPDGYKKVNRPKAGKIK